MENKFEDLLSKEKLIYTKNQERDELMAKFLGGKYRATIKVSGKAKRASVIADISQLEMRKALGYIFEFSFASDFNVLMKVGNKIQRLGYSILIEANSIKIIKRDNLGAIVITSTTAKDKLCLTTYYVTFYKFIEWYFKNIKKEK